MTKLKMIDLFAGCGGLSEGFLKSDLYQEIAAVEWLKPQVNTLRHRLKTKWKISNVDEHVMHFDIQRENELFLGWDDSEYGKNPGLDKCVKDANGSSSVREDQKFRIAR